jgi:hypothetical protein
VRVSIGHVRERLDAYFATEGSHQPLRLLLPRGQYRVEFRPVEVKPTPAAGPAPVEFSSTRHFWQPYLAAGAPNVIGYTEPLFFHNSSGLYVRDWFSNQPDAPTETLRRLPNWEDYRPSYHYLSSGEMHCLLSLTRMFQEMRVGVETRNVRLSSWKELRDSNLVLLGCARTNPFLVSVEGESAFRVCERWIENVSPQAGEQERYEGRRFQDGKLVRLIEYAVITRRPGFSPERAITLLASNHGRGIEAIGHMLTLEDRTRDLLEWAGFAAARPLPRHFQVLVRVEAVDIDDEIMHVEPVARRILAE